MKIYGYSFSHVCMISPKRNSQGTVETYMPQNGYLNKNRLPLHAYGEGPFCTFSIPNDWRGKGGVYLLISNGKVVYVGECQDLSGRFNASYGHISPRNCYLGGQQTNCRINYLIYTEAELSNVLELWFLPQPSKRKVIEAELKERLAPPWNK